MYLFRLFLLSKRPKGFQVQHGCTIPCRRNNLRHIEDFQPITSQTKDRRPEQMSQWNVNLFLYRICNRPNHLTNYKNILLNRHIQRLMLNCIVIWQPSTTIITNEVFLPTVPTVHAPACSGPCGQVEAVSLTSVRAKPPLSMSGSSWLK